VREAHDRAPILLEQIREYISTPPAQRELSRRFITLLEGNQFQEIFDLVIAGARLDVRQADMFMVKVNTDPRRFVVSITLDNDYVQQIPFNDNTTNFIEDLVKKGFQDQTLRSFGSDTIDSILIEGIKDIQIEEYVYTGTTQPGNSTGRFFPYTNTTELDMSRYQIFTQKQAYNKQIHTDIKHCFIQALELSGLENAILNRVVLAIETGAHFAKKHIKTVEETIKRKIIIHTYTHEYIKKAKYGEGEVLNIALYQGHYFVFEDTIYTRFFVNNYEKLKNYKNAHDITRLSQHSEKPVYGSVGKLNSLTLVKLLFDSGHFKKLDMKRFAEASSHKQTRDVICLDSIGVEQREAKQKKVKKNEREIYFADTETFTSGEKHQLFMLGFCGQNEDCRTVHTVSTKDPPQAVVDKWLKNMIKRGAKDAEGNHVEADVICYFHNLKYDYNVLEPYLKVQSKVEKEGQLYAVTVRMCGNTVELRDSLKMIPFALSKFGKEFSLPRHLRKKEAIAYGYYTPDNTFNKITVDEYSKYLTKKEKKLFLNELVPSITSFDPVTRTFSPYSYYVDYLKMDCEVLRAGMKAFDSCITNITDDKISAFDCLTIYSLTDKYAIGEGAYNGVYEVCGNLREYIAKAVYGGRVCVNPKFRRKVLSGRFSDYDGVSLYPSSIDRLCREKGFPIGKAKRFEQSQLVNWKDTDYAVLTVQITSVNKHQQMPFIAHKGAGVINYTNEAPADPIVIDKTTLEDYIKFHKIEYELLDGVYWDEGYNTKMGEVIQRLFNERLRHKKLGNNATQNALKLMMNSAYGKTFMKKSKTEKKIIKGSDEDLAFKNYICKNFHIIKNFRKANDNFYEIEQLKADFSYNRGHIGCSILSMSKRIMNAVFDIANTRDYNIYYQFDAYRPWKCTRIGECILYRIWQTIEWETARSVSYRFQPTRSRR
jgi:hypothetical protein